MIKAILSDGGNILFDDNRDRKFFVDYVHQKTGMPEAQIERDLAYMKEKLRRYSRDTSPGKPEDKTKAAYQDLLQKYHLTDFLGEFSEIYTANSKRKRELFPGVRDTLESLDGKVDFIIVTDATKPGSYLQQSLRERMGVQKGVKNVVSSVDVGWAKPAPEFFNEVLKRNNYQPEEVVFIGHDYDEVVGAYRFGIPHVIVFNYDPRELERIREAIPAENLHVIPNTDKKDNFDQVSKILEKIIKSQG